MKAGDEIRYILSLLPKLRPFSELDISGYNPKAKKSDKNRNSYLTFLLLSSFCVLYHCLKSFVADHVFDPAGIGGCSFFIDAEVHNKFG